MKRIGWSQTRPLSPAAKQWMGVMKERRANLQMQKDVPSFA
jgi:hypothetical protein